MDQRIQNLALSHLEMKFSLLGNINGTLICRVKNELLHFIIILLILLLLLLGLKIIHKIEIYSNN